MCNDQIGDEKHVSLASPLYADFRSCLFIEALKCTEDIYNLQNDDNFLYLFKK